ncbi:hypothetical protein N802_12740 [Knoellia sinensis KCTC 19936]|uniref:Uncharacterized protein n=1 Tax=Knoellia sinensis KCTC 19936 TaxID=1385520 RepID=A0A0A0JB87_9MICO|nr:hypothetical protein [Knoellia sinensis]KGN34413.1 hypothetical protein N802_12740 [Knoellia sinensis KCTC 19936]
MKARVVCGRRVQRFAVVLALFAVLSGLLVFPIRGESSARALTDTHQCGANDANRATLRTHHGGIQMRPCLTGTNVNMNIPLGPWGYGSYPFCALGCYERRFQVDEIRRIGQEAVRMADGSTQNLWHFSFARFQVNKAMTFRTTNGTGHTASFIPDAFSQLGGKNDQGVVMYTDLWITDGSFGISGFCGTPVAADSFLVALVQGSDIAGCQMNLNIKYLVTYNATPGATGQYPLRMPKTTVTVQ